MIMMMIITVKYVVKNVGSGSPTRLSLLFLSIPLFLLSILTRLCNAITCNINNGWVGAKPKEIIQVDFTFFVPSSQIASIVQFLYVFFLL